MSYRENVGQLQQQFDDLKVRVAQAWDVADDEFDSARKNLELEWTDWELRAKKIWKDSSRQVLGRPVQTRAR